MAQVDLSRLINEAKKVSEAYTDEDAMNDLGNIPVGEGGLPVACGAPCQHEPSQREAGIGHGFSFQTFPQTALKECAPAKSRSVRLTKKRSIKCREQKEKEKESEREAR